MKYAGIYLMLTMLLLCFTANAQKDTIYIKGLSMDGKRDTIFLRGVSTNNKKDTIYIKTVVNGQLRDTFFVSDKVSFDKRDTLYLSSADIAYISGGNQYVYRAKDSLLRHKAYVAYKSDSLLKNNRFKDYKKQDSLYTVSGREFKRTDSLRKESGMYVGNGKGYRIFKNGYDSTYRTGKDTLRLKKELNRLKGNLERIKLDSIERLRSMNKKEISMEVNCSKNGTVTIKNLSRKIVIRTFNEKKVRLVTTVYAEPGFETKDVDWEKELNIGIEQTKNEVTIKPAGSTTISVSSSANPGGAITLGYSYSSATGVSGAGQGAFSKNRKSEVVIYIPSGAKLVVENRYNDVAILNDLTMLDADLLNVNLKMQDADKATIRSKYGSVNAGDIKEADLNLLNCKFTSGNIDKLIIDSRYSTVTFKNSGVIDMTSVSDQYSIAQAGTLTVNKNFGKLNIGGISNSIEFTGSSADLNINEINASTKSIKINNKYADVKLPVKSLNNYTVQFDGDYSKVYTPFETETETNNGRRTTNTNFTKTVGNVKKGFTAFAVSCTSCSVDFR
ncbi:DUF4097 domain-containing protein [Ferruginibacter sp. HRS2-29]|uniref:DUF4097 domain-containing protein n=1 Tax=Ferruginibacter sp. HRS2-29 TaxID=2487334 RepID=UPI0020CC80F4|nr:DUF4097 domain-containing protein [Ferruginibacter sp. HRS2-29]MCP9751282.1 hypothetical protein [Ferruginibacter sp. HRS2-29]